MSRDVSARLVVAFSSGLGEPLETSKETGPFVFTFPASRIEPARLSLEVRCICRRQDAVDLPCGAGAPSGLALGFARAAYSTHTRTESQRISLTASCGHSGGL